MTDRYIALFSLVFASGTTKSGYKVTVPDLPTCVVYGRDYAHSLRLITEAVRAHVQNLRDTEVEIPTPRTLSQIRNTYTTRVWDTFTNVVAISAGN